MRPSLRRLPALALLGVLATGPELVGGCAAQPVETPHAVALAGRAPARPKKPVVVTLVVDQLAAWVAAERWPLLPADGGFARLRREGTWVTAMRYEHAATDTAPGHSALYTGAVPASSGIFANEVLAKDGPDVSILHDASSHLLNADGPLDRPGSSLAALRVETLADRLRAEQPDAVILSFSLKDRGALFGAGRHPTAALWFDTRDNRFVTSSAVAGAFPSWAGAFAADAVARAEGSTWTLLDPAWVQGHSLTADDQPGEGDLPGFGVVFPHALAAAKRPSLAFRTSPFSDDVLFMLGLFALSAENATEHTTLLALSLSANDYIGHTFGPDSWEAWDELARLDRALGRFLTVLDSLFGAEGYSVLLTADHGITPMPEVGRHPYCDAPAPDPWERTRACVGAHRILPKELGRALVAAASDALGPGDWVAGVSDPFVYLTPAARALDAPRSAALRGALERTLRATPGVARAYDVAAVPRDCPPFADESVGALVCRSVAPAVRDRGAAYYVVLAPGSFFDPTVVVGKGTSHGSPYVYDRTVPLLVRAPGRVAAGGVASTTTFNAFVDTAAELLGIAPPHDAATGASLATPPPRAETRLSLP